MKILVVEDEPRLGQVLAEGLREAGYMVDTARDGCDGQALAIGGGYDRCGAPTVRGKQHSGPPVYIAAAVLFCGKT